MMHDLEAALDRAFVALRNGDLSDLGATYAMTEAILSDLRLTDAVIAARVAAKAHRNEACLLAATRGVRAARRRLAEIGPDARMTTYDANGRTSTIGEAPKGLTERL